MGRTPLFNEIARALKIARYCNVNRLTTDDGLGRVREIETKEISRRQNRREWLSTPS
jgi:monoamine oxidase